MTSPSLIRTTATFATANNTFSDVAIYRFARVGLSASTEPHSL